jgi:hypothetical protein
MDLASEVLPEVRLPEVLPPLRERFGELMGEQP